MGSGVDTVTTLAIACPSGQHELNCILLNNQLAPGHPSLLRVRFVSSPVLFLLRLKATLCIAFGSLRGQGESSLAFRHLEARMATAPHGTKLSSRSGPLRLHRVNLARKLGLEASKRDFKKTAAIQLAFEKLASNHTENQLDSRLETNHTPN